MTLTVVRTSTIAATPWRNGGGITQELLAWPTPLDWWLRLSVARIDADGPFSAYPDIERWFAVLEGAGVRLTVDSVDHMLSCADAPLRFDGAAAPACRLIAGTTRDLNLMLKRERCRGRLAVMNADHMFRSDAPLRGVYVAQATTLQRDQAAPVALPAESLAWQADAAPGCAWRVDRRAWFFECTALAADRTPP